MGEIESERARERGREGEINGERAVLENIIRHKIVYRFYVYIKYKMDECMSGYYDGFFCCYILFGL